MTFYETRWSGLQPILPTVGGTSEERYSHWVGAKVHVTRCVDLYSGQILVFSMTLMTVCVLLSV